MTPRLICRRPLLADDGALPGELPPVLARIYRARNVGAGELAHTLDRLRAPALLKGMDRAAELLAEAVVERRRMLVVADFDADGATSCALVLRALRLMGATADYIVPNRFEYGYGLTPEIVALAAERGPELLITVDNGISSIEGVRAARALGIRVLITDHHLPGRDLPEAEAIVNPNQPGDEFPSKHLAGVGVAFYCMLALRARLRGLGWFARQGIAEPNLGRLLDLVALGTVADLVPLDHNNRVLVAQGLGRMRAGLACEGIRALATVAGRVPARLRTGDLGYCLAPRLNAAGRLQDMSLGIECLLTDDPARAADLARQLDELNRERRVIEAEMQAQAVAAIDALRLEGAALPRALCVYDPGWHQGVIGLVASRLKERLHRPVIAFARGSESELKGSARSIAGLHVRDALDAVATRHPGLVSRFGGHAMAAGLSLPQEHFERFREAFAAEVGRQVCEDDLQGRVYTDGELRDEELTLALAEQLCEAGPWGQAFPEPVFDGHFHVLDRRLVGERHVKLKLKQDGSRVFEAIGFNLAPDGRLPEWTRIRAAYRLEPNEYRGVRTLQLVLEHLELAEPI